jgi:hypothetical protein
MSVRSKWLFVLLGRDKTGKTELQKRLVELLNGRSYKKLPSNQVRDITHPYLMRKVRKLFVGGASYQEQLNKGDYSSVGDYFSLIGRADSDVDLAIISAHLDLKVVQEIIAAAHRRFWNTCGVFLSNAVLKQRSKASDISEFAWDERWFLDNAPSEQMWQHQIEQAANVFVQMLIERTRGW